MSSPGAPTSAPAPEATSAVPKASPEAGVGLRYVWTSRLEDGSNRYASPTPAPAAPERPGAPTKTRPPSAARAAPNLSPAVVPGPTMVPRADPVAALKTNTRPPPLAFGAPTNRSLPAIATDAPNWSFATGAGEVRVKSKMPVAAS